MMKCIDCGRPIEETIENKDSESYRCEKGHKNQRMIQNNNLKTTEENEIVHHSVGIIVKNNNELLLLKRRKYPTKFSIPAGHLEKGENPDQAVLRELEEETGIKDADNVRKILEKTMPDKCRRGADKHHWHLYITELDNRPEIESNDEAEFSKWASNPLELDLTEIVERLLSQEVDRAQIPS